MERIELRILYKDGNEEKIRAIANKWTFSDTMMGEQAVMCNIVSEKPIPFAVGDYCVFRGETYTLNYIPSVTQKAKTGEIQDAYTYENVKFDSYQDELSRCMLLDVTPTTDEYIAAYGTNYTGSSKFTLYCGESTVNGRTLTAVCTLAAKIQANLDRMYSRGTWSVLVDTETTYVSPSGGEVLMTHTDDKMLSFDNSTVIQALAEVHNAFDLNYCIRGRVIYIGFQMPDLTENDGLGQGEYDEDEDVNSFAFGYGKGYPRHGNDGKGLFKIKRIANSQQRIVTRLRAMGSTKNMPYRYYNKKYGGESNPELTQSLFPTNLQLPGTFLPEGNPTDAASATGATKWSRNNARSEFLRKVKGDTNDAYIDKNDNAANCEEGIREGNARWDGSNSDLQEIYPTIEGVKYIELREALVQDMDGKAGGNGESSASAFYPYQNQERIDKLLAIGYMDNGSMVDDANIGDGILPESGSLATGIPRTSEIELTSLRFNQSGYGDFYLSNGVYYGIERRLFTVQGVTPGKYAIAPTIGAVLYGFSISCYRDGISADVGYVITIKQKNVQTGATTTIASYISEYQSVSRGDGIMEMELPELPDVKNGENAKVTEINVTALSDITVTFTPVMRNIAVPSGYTDGFSLSYQVGNSRLDHAVSYAPECNWISLDDSGSMSETFHVFIQDMGFDLSATFTGESPVVSMKSGRCVGREFEIGDNIQKVTYNGKKGYMLTLKRATDSSLNTYYPSQVSPLSAGDYFVLLNIEMPDAYILAAEARLLMAATDYLSDNSQTVFTYQPYIDDIYLRRNYDNMVKQGKREKSIFWQLYAGLKFSFNGIPSNANSPLPFAQITIEKVMITMGDGLTPKVDIVLNDDIQQTTLQKLTIAVDRIYGGSMFNTGLGSLDMLNEALVKVLQTEGERFFLSKNHDDVSQGVITFLNGVAYGARQLWKIDGNGNAILNNLNAQEAIFNKLTAQEAHFFTLIIDEIRSIGGQLVISPANCRIDKVEDVGDGYKCYFKASDAERTINNQWQVGMQAIHIEFNVEEGGSQNYWRVVTDKSSDPVSIDINDSEVRCHWIVLSKGFCKEDSTAPQAGDDLSQLGFNEAWYKSTHNGTLPENVSDLENAIVISAYNIPFIDLDAFRDSQPIKAPLYVSYRNINSFNVGASNRVAVIAGNGNYLSAVLRLENDSTLADGREINDLGITDGNLVRNSGFTGNYESEEVGEDNEVSADTVIFSDPLKFWESTNVEVNSVDDTTISSDYKDRIGKSVSGSVAIINNGLLKQTIESGISANTWHVLSFKACCPDTTDTTLSVSLGGVTNAVTVYNSVQRVDLPFKSTAADSILTFQATSKVMLMDVMLIRGNIPSEYQKSEKDNDKSVAKFLGLSYLQRAITEASTEILGGLILTQLIKVGMYRDKQFTQETGGMSGLYIDEHSPFLYGGGTLEQAIYTAMKYSNPRYQPTDDELAQMAKFVVTHGGRAILNDICLRGYIYALGGVFGNVQSVDGKWSLDENGIMKCIDAWISGSIYTPYTIINNENISDYATLQEITMRYYTHTVTVDAYVLNLESCGLNIQVDFIPQQASAAMYIKLPLGEKYNGAEVNVFANKVCAIVGVSRASMASQDSYELFNPILSKGQKAKLKCFKDGSDYRWIIDSFVDSMRFREPIKLAQVEVLPQLIGDRWVFFETLKSYHSSSSFTYERTDTGVYKIYLPSDWNAYDVLDMFIVAYTGSLDGNYTRGLYASVIGTYSSDNSFVVYVADDSSTNDGNFGFSIYLNRDGEAYEIISDESTNNE